MESLKKEKDDLANKLSFRSQEVKNLNAEINTLKGQVRNVIRVVLNIKVQQ